MNTRDRMNSLSVLLDEQSLVIEELSLCCKFNESHLARKWFRAMQEAMNAGQQLCLTRIIDSEQSTNELLNKAHQLYKKLRSLQVIDLPNMDGIESFKDQSLLNALHLKIQDFEENRTYERHDPEILIETVHQKVYKIEANLKKHDLLKREVMLFLQLKEGDFEESLERQDYSQFSLPDVHGEIYLGYSTVGKNLWTCFRDNDIEVIHQHRVKPQLTYRSQFIIYLKEPHLTKFDDELRREHLKMYRHWCEDQNVKTFGYDLNSEIHQAGLGRLGHCTTTQSIDEILHNIQSLSR